MARRKYVSPVHRAILHRIAERAFGVNPTGSLTHIDGRALKALCRHGWVKQSELGIVTITPLGRQVLARADLDQSIEDLDAGSSS
ncbi:MAG: hypothetical protein JKY94_16675 [Rhodobacteraceae bacterium]|nr:hypothetical protein [Paracoccaceae bacterium]